MGEIEQGKALAWPARGWGFGKNPGGIAKPGQPFDEQGHQGRFNQQLHLSLQTRGLTLPHQAGQEAHKLEAVAKALLAHQDQVAPQDQVAHQGLGGGSGDVGLGSGSSGGHQGKGLAVALQAHQHLAVGPKVGLAIS